MARTATGQSVRSGVLLVVLLAGPAHARVAGAARDEDPLHASDGASAGGLVLPSRSDGPYQLRWTTDLPIVAGSAALWSAMLLMRDQEIRKSCPCSSSDLAAFERVALGRSDPAGTASDLLVGAALAAPLLLDALDVARSAAGWQGYWEDLAVAAEAILVNGAINEVMKSAASRPRPRIYDLPAGDPALSSTANYTSFYSGHTSTAFAAGMAYAFTYAHRHPEDPKRWAVYGGAFLIGGGVGVLRVAAGAHFPTDVIVGAVAGASVGTIVPWLHRRSPTTSFAVTPVDGGGIMAVSGTLH